MKNNDNHIELINHACDLFDSDKKNQALERFKEAQKLAPKCPSAIYNLANCYYHLKEEKKAIILLEGLLKTENKELRMGCPDETESPRQYKLDALFVLFRAKLFYTQSWNKAYPFAEQHLNTRCRGLKSSFKLKEVKYWINYYKNIFNAKSKLRTKK